MGRERWDEFLSIGWNGARLEVSGEEMDVIHRLESREGCFPDDGLGKTAQMGVFLR